MNRDHTLFRTVSIVDNTYINDLVFFWAPMMYYHCASMTFFVGSTTQLDRLEVRMKGHDEELQRLRDGG